MTAHGTYHEYSKARAEFREDNDCTVIATSVVTDTSYEAAHKLLADHGRKRGKGLVPSTYHKAIKLLDFEIVSVYGRTASQLFPTLTSKTVRTIERELAKKFGGCKLMIGVDRHVLAWNGSEIVDWSVGRCKQIRDAYIVFPKGNPPRPKPLDALTNPSKKHFGRPGTLSQFMRMSIYRNEPKDEIIKKARELFNPDVPASYYDWYVNDMKKKKLIA